MSVLKASDLAEIIADIWQAKYLVLTAVRQNEPGIWFDPDGAAALMQSAGTYLEPLGRFGIHITADELIPHLEAIGASFKGIEP